MTRVLHHLAFGVGLLTVGWVGAAYLPGNPLALALVGLVGAFFLMGALELHRFRQATAGLAQALAAAQAPVTDLGDWIAPLHPSLRHAVRLRVEGERVPLPGPSLAPYLSGLLVLLGMLGTFLGMVATLRGTGLALENATDVEAIRASLAAPVKGLGLAFGTSVAGVAASAMLGLMVALARRDRQRVGQRLDARVATSLRGHSRAHQREASLRLLEAQTEVMSTVMPALVNQVEHLVGQVTRQGQALQDGLLADQARFHGEAQRAYAGLAASVDRSMKESLAESARLAGAAIEPAVQATMAGLARETTALREALAAAVHQQLEGTTARLEATGALLADRWQAALADQQRHGEAAQQGLQQGLDRFAQTFEERSASLLDGVAARLDRSAVDGAAAWREALAQQGQGHDALVRQMHEAVTATVTGVEQHTGALLRGLADAHEAQGRRQEGLVQQSREALASTVTAIDQQAAGLLRGVAEAHEAQARRDEALVAQTGEALAGTVTGFEQHATGLLRGVAEAQEAQADRHEALMAQTREALAATVTGFEQHAGGLLRSVTEAHGALDAAAVARERERQAAFHDGLAALTATWQREGRDSSEAMAARQEAICATLERTAQAITAQAEAQARDTLGEIARLVATASEAPRAAAEVIGELRQALSDSLVRDNAVLEERNRLMATLGGLLDAVNHASTAQREAIDALVQSTTEVMARAGTRFADTVEAESSALQAVAAQLQGSAADVASLGEGLAAAVQVFSEAGAQLTGQLQGIEAALGRSMARSDEQLAYYVAQAREIVDLTLGSQRQIVEDMQRLAAPAPASERAKPTAPSAASPASTQASPA